MSAANTGETSGPAVFVWEESVDLDAEPYPELVLRVRNEDQLPVHDVKIRVPVGVRGTFVRDLHSIGPEETQEIRVAIPAPPRSSRVDAEVSFADTHGRTWLRTVTGDLEQVDEPPVFSPEPGAYRPEDHPTLHIESEGHKVAT